MGLLVPSGQYGYLPSNLARIADEVCDGKPEVGWRGDPALELRIGLITDRRGNHVGKSLEVWRNCEDGMARRIGRWKMSESDQIIHDLIAMDIRTPGRVNGIDAIEKADEAAERQRKRDFAEAYGPLAEHALALARDRTDGVRHLHGQAGFGEGKMTPKQRKRAKKRANAKGG